MAKLDLIPVIDEGLCNSTCLLDLGEGRALVMDPERDVREVRAQARRLGPDIGLKDGDTVALARAQYRSMQRLMELPDEKTVWPTPGAGSFCTAAAGGDRVTTIGRERATNPLLQVTGEDDFVAALLGSLGNFPDYFLRLGEINRQGPAVLGTAPDLPALTADRGRELMGQGRGGRTDVTVLDGGPSDWEDATFQALEATSR